MMLPPSQLEMPSHQEKGMTTSITLDPSNLVSISLYLPSFIAVLSLATTLARIATLPLDCAIVTVKDKFVSTIYHILFHLMLLFFFSMSDTTKDNTKQGMKVFPTQDELRWADQQVSGLEQRSVSEPLASSLPPCFSPYLSHFWPSGFCKVIKAVCIK